MLHNVELHIMFSSPDEDVSKSFRTESITKQRTTINTR